MRTTRASTLAALILVAATTLLAQQPPPQGPPGPRPGPGMGPGPGPGLGPDPFAGNLFPPELIMQNQQAINLSEDQRGYMLGEIQRVQSQATAIQWRLQAAMERLGGTVRQDRVDEAQVLTQLDSVLALEREMKRMQITLLVRLKSRLTPEQQAALRGRMPPHED